MARPSTPHVLSAAAAVQILALALLAITPSAAQSRHSTAQGSTASARRLSATPDLHSTHSAHRTHSIQDAQQHEAHADLHLLPHEEAQGIVTGMAGPKAEFAAAEALTASDGGRRTLLHGKRRPRDYTICPRCTPITCETGTNTCSGHCKTDRTLFTCKTNSRVASACAPPEDTPDPRTLTPDPLLERRSVQVMAPAPYIGCANITGTPNGCPDRGTTGTVAGRGRVEVVTSWCVQHLYELFCPGLGELRRGRTPFYPFGYCLCLMKDEAGAVFGGPCRASTLDWSGPDRGLDDAPVRVLMEGGETRTTFAETEQADERVLTMNHTFASSEGPITLTMMVFRVRDEPGFDSVEEGPLPDMDEDVEGDDGGELVEAGGDGGAVGAAGGADEEGGVEEAEEEEKQEEEGE